MQFNANSQEFDPERYDEALRQSDLVSQLQEKFRDRPFHEENGWWYVISVWATYIFQLINVVSGFAKPFAYLSGIFAFGVVGGIMAFLIAGFFVVVIEIAARKNLIQLFEKKYFRKRVAAGRVFAQVLLNGGIIALSYWGASDAVKIMSGDFTPSQVALESEDQIKTHYSLLITSAQKDADAFFAASNWQGKLSPANQRKYNNLLAEKAKWQSKMDEAIAQAKQKNDAKVSEAKASDLLALAEKHEKDTKNGEVLGFIAVVSCILFTVCIALKEYYEYRTAMELTKMGALSNPRFAQMIKEAEKTISDEGIRKQFSTNGIHNSATDSQSDKTTIGFRWDTYGQAKPSPTDILTRQPIWPERENTVPQSPQTVAQQNVGGGDSYADSVLELCRQTIQRDMANFENRQARNATVAARIHKALDEAYTAIKGPGFAPSYRIGLKLYSYLNETVFPSLNIKGYPYEHQGFFIERLYAAFKPQQPA